MSIADGTAFQLLANISEDGLVEYFSPLEGPQVLLEVENQPKDDVYLEPKEAEDASEMVAVDPKEISGIAQNEKPAISAKIVSNLISKILGDFDHLKNARKLGKLQSNQGFNRFGQI